MAPRSRLLATTPAQPPRICIWSCMTGTTARSPTHCGPAMRMHGGRAWCTDMYVLCTGACPPIRMGLLAPHCQQVHATGSTARSALPWPPGPAQLRACGTRLLAAHLAFDDLYWLRVHPSGCGLMTTTGPRSSLPFLLFPQASEALLAHHRHVWLSACAAKRRQQWWQAHSGAAATP